MTTSSVMIEFEKLPDNYKQEASDFIEYLLNKAFNQKNNITNSRGGLGISKGQYNLTDDFDEPIDAFKDYL